MVTPKQRPTKEELKAPASPGTEQELLREFIGTLNSSIKTIYDATLRIEERSNEIHETHEKMYELDKKLSHILIYAAIGFTVLNSIVIWLLRSWLFPLPPSQ